MANKQYYVYVMASKRDGMLYVGVTSDLIGRVYIHKNDLADGVTNKYHIHTLVYFEVTEDITSSQSREQANSDHLFFQLPLIEPCVRFSLTRLSDNPSP